ncbi:MAG: hypothetical protein WCT20_00075 [Candidatus Babeliales bacterium]|jgi:hypothetical protein
MLLSHFFPTITQKTLKGLFSIAFFSFSLSFSANQVSQDISADTQSKTTDMAKRVATVLKKAGYETEMSKKSYKCL